MLNYKNYICCRRVLLRFTSQCDPHSQLQGALNSREREIVSLRRQLDAGQNELTALQRDKDVAIRENRRLQDDLATMTREAQVGYESKIRGFFGFIWFFG